jgi:hypothetical protein
MRKPVKLGLVATTALAAALPLVAVHPAFADYAPSKSDVVGVGSDTLQYMLDFLADGDAFADPGYNATLNKFKLVSVDAIPDANARLAYGVDGGQSTQTTCTPGTGSTAGTGNAAAGAGVPCVLNPTIVLRSGTQAVQRPNGSGAGIQALEQDVTAGNNLPSGPHAEIVSFSRASAAQAPAAKFGLDSVEVATDTLPMLKDTTSNAVPLSTAELTSIYSANTCPTWNSLPGNAGGSATTIIPIIPQVGSGTRSFFLTQLGLSAPGACAASFTAEENDPTAITQQARPADAIEPISQGRLNLFNHTGLANGTTGYMLDPSCKYEVNIAACGTGTLTLNQTTVAAPSNGMNITALVGTLNVAATTGFSATGSVQVETASGNAVLNYTGTTGTSFTGVTIAGSVQGGAQSGVLSTGGNVVQSTGTYTVNPVLPAVTTITGTPGDTNPLFDPTRQLFIYFRDSDITSTVPFQPGTTENWLNTLFYNPCLTGGTGCSGGTTGTEYGPGGAPFIDQAGGQQLLTDAGVTPVDTGAAGSFTHGGA